MERLAFIKKIKKSFKSAPVTGLLGPRQCGKTTLANMYVEKNKAVHYFDLENPLDLARLEDPMLALGDLSGLIVIDEIQRRPELFPILRVLVDQKKKQEYLILGSASRDLIQQSSETLAGRINYIELTPFNMHEVKDIKRLWVRGGFPKSYLSKSNDISYDWRQSYIQTFLERDIPSFGFNIPARTLYRFWMMLTHYHGQIFNASEIGKSLGVAHTTVRNYLDILTGTFMIRELSPWFENIKQRQIKSPKIYFRDSGILHALLGVKDHQALLTHPKLGASWEGMALEEVIRHHQARPEECFFWGIHAQAELDLLIHKDGKKMGYEFKFSDAPKLTKSMQTAMEILNLDSLSVIYPGDKNYKLTNKINVIGLELLIE